MRCAVSRMKTFDPHFFKIRNQTVTVNPKRYIKMLNNHFVPVLEELEEIYVKHIWF